MVKLSWLKHRGNILEVIEELGMPEEVVRAEVIKIKEESKDPLTLIANTLSQEILIGHQSRVHLLMAILKKLSINLDQRISLCCKFPVDPIKESQEYGHKDYRCMNCHKLCDTNIITNAELVDLAKQVITELREEDKELLVFAKDMGYTNALPTTIINQKQNIVVFDNKEGENTEKIIKKVEDLLDPMARDRLIEKLDQEIVDMEVEEEKDAGDKGTKQD